MSQSASRATAGSGTVTLTEEQTTLLNEEVKDDQVIPYILRHRREGARMIQTIIQEAAQAGRTFDELLSEAARVLSPDEMTELASVRTEFNDLMVAVKRFVTRSRIFLGRMRALKIEYTINHLAKGEEEQESNKLAERARLLSVRITDLLVKVEARSGDSKKYWNLITNIGIACMVIGVATVVTGGVGFVLGYGVILCHTVLSVGAVVAGAGAVGAAIASAYTSRNYSQVVDFLRLLEKKLQGVRLRLEDLKNRFDLAKSLTPEMIGEIDGILDSLTEIDKHIEGTTQDGSAQK